MGDKKWTRKRARVRESDRNSWIGHLRKVLFHFHSSYTQCAPLPLLLYCSIQSTVLCLVFGIATQCYTPHHQRIKSIKYLCIVQTVHSSSLSFFFSLRIRFGSFLIFVLLFLVRVLYFCIYWFVILVSLPLTHTHTHIQNHRRHQAAKVCAFRQFCDFCLSLKVCVFSNFDREKQKKKNIKTNFNLLFAMLFSIYVLYVLW